MQKLTIDPNGIKLYCQKIGILLVEKCSKNHEKNMCNFLNDLFLLTIRLKKEPDPFLSHLCEPQIELINDFLLKKIPTGPESSQ